MNPFNSLAVSKEERISLPAPSDGVETVPDETLFSGMLADVLVTALGDQSSGENQNASDPKANDSAEEDVQSPVMISMALPALAPESSVVVAAGPETWCFSINLSENGEAQSPLWMKGEASTNGAGNQQNISEAALRLDGQEASTNGAGNQQNICEAASRLDGQDARIVSNVFTASDEAVFQGNNPLQNDSLSSVSPTTEAGSHSRRPSDRAVSLPSDISTNKALSNAATSTDPHGPSQRIINVPSEKTETASPTETIGFKPVAAVDDTKVLTVSIPDKTSENAPASSGADAGPPVNVKVSPISSEDDQAESRPDSGARTKPQAIDRADKGIHARPSSPNRTSGDPSNATRQGMDVDETEPAHASSEVDGGEVSSLREETLFGLSEGMRSRPADEPIQATLRPGTNVHVLNGSKTPEESMLARTDSGVAPRTTPSSIQSRVEQFEAFVSRLDQHILSASVDREKTMTVTLIPESLGKVVLNCREQGGQLWVEIQAANPSVREVIQRQEDVIRQMMDQSGCKLMQFDVHSQTGEGDLGRFRRPSQENEDATAGEGFLRPVGRGTASESVVAESPTELRKGLWVVA